MEVSMDDRSKKDRLCAECGDRFGDRSQRGLLIEARSEEAIGSVPKGLKKGSASCRWKLAVDEEEEEDRHGSNEYRSVNEQGDVDWIDELKKKRTATPSVKKCVNE